MIETNSHIKSIECTIKELIPISESTGVGRSSIASQYVGTIIDNTLVQLVGVCNSLDGGSRIIRLSEFNNWVSAMQAVHRAFYSSIVMAIEKGLSDYCSESDINLVRNREQQAKSCITKIEKEIDKELSSNIKKSIYELSGSHYEFMDYISAIVKANIDKKRQTIWTNYFKALSILRNKASHFDVSLSDYQRKFLSENGFKALVSESGELQLNTRNYKQIIEYVLQFYKEAGLA